MRDAQRRAVPHWAVVPALALTFMLGPVGLLLYCGVRVALGKRELKIENEELKMPGARA